MCVWMFEDKRARPGEFVVGRMSLLGGSQQKKHTYTQKQKKNNVKKNEKKKKEETRWMFVLGAVVNQNE